MIKPNSNYEYNWVALTGGVIAGLFMTVFTNVTNLMGFNALSLELLYGSFFVRDVNASAWIIGFAIHIVASGLIGLAYGALFRWLRRSGPDIGVALGMAHWLITGIALWMLPAIHPLVPEAIESPGFCAIAYGGLTFLVNLLAHLLFGGIMGGIYRIPTDQDQSVTTEGDLAPLRTLENSQSAALDITPVPPTVGPNPLPNPVPGIAATKPRRGERESA